MCKPGSYVRRLGATRRGTPKKRVRTMMTEQPAQDGPKPEEQSKEAIDIGSVMRRRFRGNGFGFGGDKGLGG